MPRPDASDSAGAGAGAGLGAGAGTLVPERCEIVRSTPVCEDVVTLEVAAPEAVGFVPGQFDMLTAFGVGEAAISISSAPGSGGDDGTVAHTIRDVGPVTRALCRAPVGTSIGVRGPFGTGWVRRSVAELDDLDVVVVAGGIGLAPLRGMVEALATRVAAGARGGRTALAVGARAPEQLVFADDLERWRAAGVEVAVAVDAAGTSWRGEVGVVTALLPRLAFDAARAVALVCGPEVMMRFSVRALLDRGLPLGAIRMSLERNMQCGLGWCGHCQLGPLLLCRDGPVLPCSDALLALLSQRER